jgi:hypothetical protein
MQMNSNFVFIEYPGRDWKEDKDLENGNYQCLCVVCKRFFIGHKRRLICFECYNNQK